MAGDPMRPLLLLAAFATAVAAPDAAKLRIYELGEAGQPANTTGHP